MSEFHDPYTDPSTGVLRNKLGLSSQDALNAAEADLTWARATQLPSRRIRATNDLAELRAIHRHLFQDIYDWAGKIRTVDIRKNVPGAEFFVPVAMIERSAGFAAEALQDDDLLRGMPRERLVGRLAFHYDQFNYLHPFREGNGRTQRLFWSRVVRGAGYDLDWRGVGGATNNAACQAAGESQDLDPLIKLFDRITSHEP